MLSNAGSGTSVYCLSPSSLTGRPACASAMSRSATAQFSLSSAFRLLRSASVQMPASILLLRRERENRDLTAAPDRLPVPAESHSANRRSYRAASAGFSCSWLRDTLAGPDTGGIVWEGPLLPPMSCSPLGSEAPPRGGSEGCCCCCCCCIPIPIGGIPAPRPPPMPGPKPLRGPPMPGPPPIPPACMPPPPMPPAIPPPIIGGPPSPPMPIPIPIMPAPPPCCC
jgi:hypothetical protein